MINLHKGMIMDPKIVHILNLLKKYSPEKVILFGSQAKNSCDFYSDIKKF
jgi:predicted nucleotidyltransferase